MNVPQVINQEEIDRIFGMLQELDSEVRDLRKRVRSCEVEIERLERNKADQ